MTIDAYLHKLQLLNIGARLLIFAVSHKYEYKLFVFEYFNNKISTLKKYKNIHNSIYLLIQI